MCDAVHLWRKYSTHTQTITIKTNTLVQTKQNNWLYINYQLDALIIIYS